MRRALGAAVLVAALACAASPAHAAPVSEVAQGDHVRIVSTIDREAIAAMRPGDVVRWDLEISADAPEPGTLEIAVRGAGALGLTVDARACASPWRGDDCRTGAEHVLADWRPLAAPGREELVQVVDAARPTFLRLGIAAQGDAAPGASTELRVVVDGFGEQVSAGAGDVPRSRGPLAVTGGGAPAAALVAIGVALCLAGAAALARRRRGAAS